MKAILLLALGISYLQNIHAQNKLPVVPASEFSHVDIKGIYTPRDEFLAMFPNFSSSGIYLFDIDNSIGPDPDRYNNYDRSFYRGLYKFNSSEFPVFEETTINNLSGIGNMLIQFTTDCDLSKSFFSKFKLGNKKGGLVNSDVVTSKTDIDYFRSSIGLDKNIKEQYDKLNSLYKQSVTSLFDKKKSDGYLICDLGTLEIPTAHVSNADIILQFVYVQSNLWAKNKTADKFPSHSLFKLLVKNNFGDILGSYGQGIFIEGKGYEIQEPVVLNVTLPIAFENLVNRFLNDKKIIEKIRKDNLEESVLKKNSSHYDSLCLYKSKYNIIRSKKQQLLFDLYPINDSYDAIIEDNKDRERQVLNRDKTLDNNILTSLLAANNFGTLAGEIRDRIEKNEKKLFMLEQVSLAIREEEKKFIDNLSNEFTEPSDLTFILNTKDIEDSKLNTLLSKLTNKKGASFEAFENTSKVVSNDFGPAFMSNINSLLNQNQSSTSPTNPKVESLATTNGGTGGGNDQCSLKAQSELYKSSEYKNMMASKTNANISDYKAKMIELTLQYCRDKLPQNEITNLEKVARETRQLAKDLRSQTPNINLRN